MLMGLKDMGLMKDLTILVIDIVSSKLYYNL